MHLNNSCGPDNEHIRNHLVTVFEPNGIAQNNDGLIPFYGGGCMMLPYSIKSDAEMDEGRAKTDEEDTDRSSDQEEDEKLVVESEIDAVYATDDGDESENMRIWKETRKLRRGIRQLPGGGYGYFMNNKYQIMRLKYSISAAMARIHPDLEHYQQLQQEEEGKKTKKLIRLAFSEYRNGTQGRPRADRLCDRLIKEQNLSILSTQICRISLSILNLKLFDTFINSNIIQNSIQSIGFDTTKMRLGINQIYIKLQTYEDYMQFLKESPNEENGAEEHKLWHFVDNHQKCEMIEHREYLQIAHNLYNYITNNQDDNDHYGTRKALSGDLQPFDTYDDDREDEEDEEEEEVDDEYDEDDMSRSSLSNAGDTNHNLYREKYAALKQTFIPKLLRSVIIARNDIEYIHTGGHDENDIFFMKIGQIIEILLKLPAFLKLFLSHFTSEFFTQCTEKNNGSKSSSKNRSRVSHDGSDHDNEHENFHYDAEIAEAIQMLAIHKNIHLRNEKDELVHQLIVIRIALEIFQCVINSAKQFRQENKSYNYDLFHTFNRTLWNYSNHVRSISIKLCQLIIPFLHKINPLLSASTSSVNTARSRDVTVIDTDSNHSYYDYILKKEKNEIYRNLNEISRMILESYRIELSSLENMSQFQDHSAMNTLHNNYYKHRSYLIKNLYELYPMANSLERWKTDLVKDSVHKLAFDYGECEYLVILCDERSLLQPLNVYFSAKHNIGEHSKQNIFNICVQRFIENLLKYKEKFMNAYFKAHENDIDAFLCINLRKSNVWNTYKRDRDEQIEVLLNQCISNYVSTHSPCMNQKASMIDEYALLHNICIDRYRDTAQQLLHITVKKDNNHQNLDDQNINLSMAKLCVFAGDDAANISPIDDDDDNKEQMLLMGHIEEELLWVNAKRLLQRYAELAENIDGENEQFLDNRYLNRLSKQQIIRGLISFVVKDKRKLPNVVDIEQILLLIYNVDGILTENELSTESLLIVLIEHIFDFNKQDWNNLHLITINPKEIIFDDVTSMQIINRSAIFAVSQYLYNRKSKAVFVASQKQHVEHDRDMDAKNEGGDMDPDDEQNGNGKGNGDTEAEKLWDLWKYGMSYCSQTDKNKYYYAIRAFAHAQNKKL